MEKEPTLENIKSACKAHFGTSLECDVLAGEWGQSFSHADQIKNWKVIHVRFIEDFLSQDTEIQRYKSEPCQGSPSKEIQKRSKSSSVPKSVSVSAMLKMGKLIVPENEVVTLKVEEFSIEQGMTWLESIEVTMSVQCKPFAEGACRQAYMAKVLTGLSKGYYVLKKYKKDEVEGIASLFESIESHTRKSVQLNALAKNFAENMQLNAPFEEFGNSFAYNKVYFACSGHKFVTVEKFIDGTFTKWINNTGDTCVDRKKSTEISLKAETFVHYTYIKSKKQLMVTDIQGIEYSLCDPEIASTTQVDPVDETVYFCTGNLSTLAIKTFSEHT